MRFSPPRPGGIGRAISTWPRRSVRDRELAPLRYPVRTARVFLDWPHDHRRRGIMKALLLENIHPEAERLLTERGVEFVTAKGALDEAELVEALAGVQLLGIRSKTQVTRE